MEYFVNQARISRASTLRAAHTLNCHSNLDEYQKTQKTHLSSLNVHNLQLHYKNFIRIIFNSPLAFKLQSRLFSTNIANFWQFCRNLAALLDFQLDPQLHHNFFSSIMKHVQNQIFSNPTYQRTSDDKLQQNEDSSET